MQTRFVNLKENPDMALDWGGVHAKKGWALSWARGNAKHCLTLALRQISDVLLAKGYMER